MKHWWRVKTSKLSPLWCTNLVKPLRFFLHDKMLLLLDYSAKLSGLTLIYCGLNRKQSGDNNYLSGTIIIPLLSFAMYDHLFNTTSCQVPSALVHMVSLLKHKSCRHRISDWGVLFRCVCKIKILKSNARENKRPSWQNFVRINSVNNCEHVTLVWSLVQSTVTFHSNSLLQFLN